LVVPPEWVLHPSSQLRHGIFRQSVRAQRSSFRVRLAHDTIKTSTGRIRLGERYCDTDLLETSNSVNQNQKAALPGFMQVPPLSILIYESNLSLKVNERFHQIAHGVLTLEDIVRMLIENLTETVEAVI
jgi:hypothetical protein